MRLTYLGKYPNPIHSLRKHFHGIALICSVAHTFAHTTTATAWRIRHSTCSGFLLLNVINSLINGRSALNLTISRSWNSIAYTSHEKLLFKIKFLAYIFRPVSMYRLDIFVHGYHMRMDDTRPVEIWFGFYISYFFEISFRQNKKEANTLQCVSASGSSPLVFFVFFSIYMPRAINMFDTLSEVNVDIDQF